MGEIRNIIFNTNLQTENSVNNLSEEKNNKEFKQYRHKIFKQLEKFQSELNLKKLIPLLIVLMK